MRPLQNTSLYSHLRGPGDSIFRTKLLGGVLGALELCMSESLERTAAEAELEQRQRHLSTLQQEQRGEIGSERAHSLDQLRNELLARIETRSVAAASNRPSIMLNEDGRKTLLNQREVFEVLKQRFHEAQEATDAEPELVISNSDRELELEEELRKFRKEHVELKIKLTSPLTAKIRLPMAIHMFCAQGLAYKA